MQQSPDPRCPPDSTSASTSASLQPEPMQRDKRIKLIDAVTPAYGKIKRKKETDPDFHRENKRRNNARQAKYRQKKKEREKEAAEVTDSAAGNSAVSNANYSCEIKANAGFLGENPSRASV
jgi:hypothetical protein